MAILNVNPTRMEMTSLKKRLSTAKRGHKLLKDKQDELMRQFISLIKENKELRKKAEEKLTKAFQKFVIASSSMSQAVFEEAVALPKETIGLDITEENVMSVLIPRMEFIKGELEENPTAIYSYGYAFTSAELDGAVRRLLSVMDTLLKLAQVEKTCQLMASEIEKTRRRVNALEYRTIPDLEDTIYYIRMHLDENERSTITRLMKVKDIIAKEEGLEG